MALEPESIGEIKTRPKETVVARRFTFLPHALEDMVERNVTEERVRATVEEPEMRAQGRQGRSFGWVRWVQAGFVIADSETARSRPR